METASTEDEDDAPAARPPLAPLSTAPARNDLSGGTASTEDETEAQTEDDEPAQPEPPIPAAVPSAQLFPHEEEEPPPLIILDPTPEQQDPRVPMSIPQTQPAAPATESSRSSHPYSCRRCHPCLHKVMLRAAAVAYQQRRTRPHRCSCLLLLLLLYSNSARRSHLVARPLVRRLRARHPGTAKAAESVRRRRLLPPRRLQAGRRLRSASAPAAPAAPAAAHRSRRSRISILRLSRLRR